MRGDTCETQGCPGHGTDCTGHGECNTNKQTCSCNPGWTDSGCHIVKCTNDCSGHGDCIPVDEPYCKCHPSYFGTSCEHQCQHGNITEGDDGSEFCLCDECYNEDQLDCSVLCSGNGVCNGGMCDCGTNGWRGDFCEQPGCPGSAGPSPSLGCSGHGSCKGNLGQIGECDCNENWFGDGCDIAICTNNCSGNGVCNATKEVPFCECEPGWMNDDCSIFCHGTVMDNECVCDSECSDPGDQCLTECNDVGRCVDGACVCYNETGYNPLGLWGKRCTDQKCPGYKESCSGRGVCKADGSCTCTQLGWLGDWCHEPDCPGSPDCREKGECDITQDPPKCKCFDGYMGPECENECVNGEPNADGSVCECESCYTGDSCIDECNNHGQCDNGTCVCDTAWWGKFSIVLHFELLASVA